MSGHNRKLSTNVQRNALLKSNDDKKVNPDNYLTAKSNYSLALHAAVLDPDLIEYCSGIFCTLESLMSFNPIDMKECYYLNATERIKCVK